MNPEEKDGGFISHLTELRKRLINSFIFLASNFSTKWMLNNKIKIGLSFLIIIVFALNFSYIYIFGIP